MTETAPRHERPTTEVHVLSTETIAPGRRREWLCEVIGREYARVDIHCPPAQPLFNEMTIYAQGELRLSVVRSGAIALERPRRPTLPDTQDVYLAALPLRGSYFLEQDGRDVSLRPGDMTIYDAAQAHRIRCPEAFAKLIVSFPRAMLRDRLADADNFTARRIGGDCGVGALAASSMRAFAAQAGVLSDQAFLTASQHCADLIALALTETAGARAVEPGRAATLRRVQRFVDSRLRDPELCVAAIARDVGLSPRYVNALFAGQNLSPMRYVWARRLDSCRADLLSPKLAEAPIGQIALSWGFNDLSHFSRTFKARFGVSPRAARAGLRR